eukprot:scaffold99572_cov22-Cyclotella_meneghiniana.AAC.2
MASPQLLFLSVGPISLQIEVRGFKMRSLVRGSPVGLVIGDQQGPRLSPARGASAFKFFNFFLV